MNSFSALLPLFLLFLSAPHPRPVVMEEAGGGFLLWPPAGSVGAKLNLCAPTAQRVPFVGMNEGRGLKQGLFQ